MGGCYKNKITNIHKLYLEYPLEFQQIIKERWYILEDKINYESFPDDCWYVNKGYNVCQLDIKGHHIYGYVISFVYHFNQIPRYLVMHLCNNRNCVNPDHLMAGNHNDNYQYARMFNDCYNKEIAPDGFLNTTQTMEYLGFKHDMSIFRLVKNKKLIKNLINNKPYYLINDLDTLKGKYGQKANNNPN